MIPVTVITGFLGSGKTTLINRLVRDPAMGDAAVLVNEFGEIGLDHELVEHVDETTVLVGAGCLCCSLRGELVAGIKTLLARRAQGAVPAFGHLLIETTGLADPAPVLHTLLADDTLKRACRPAGVVTTVDALHGGEQLDRNPESLRQATAADRIVLTKTELAGERDLQRLRARLLELNPGAGICEGPVTPAMLLSGAPENTARWLDAAKTALAHDPRIGSVSLETEVPLGAHHLVAWIERTMALCGDRLLRFKGIAHLEGCAAPVAVHGVQHVFHPLERLHGWRGAAPRTRMVLIGENLPRSRLETGFADLVARCSH
jgi:G3E family GTPase